MCVTCFVWFEASRVDDVDDDHVRSVSVGCLSLQFLAICLETRMVQLFLEDVEVLQE